jgi:tRNA (adenine37-N6)-methyltransferase
MEISPIAYFRSPVGGKFGLPRQAGLASSLRGEVVLESGFASPEALRGLEGFDYIWLIWGFSLNRSDSSGHLTVRPPRLGGNTRVGVFASRSPYRPNPLGLSSVHIESINFEKGIISVLGADLADGTPIFDIKPYIEYADSHPSVRSGFTDGSEWRRLEVELPDTLAGQFSHGQLEALRELLAEDPRPRYQDDPERVYGLKFEGCDVRFKVSGNILTVVEIV